MLWVPGDGDLELEPSETTKEVRREKWNQFRAETREEYELSVSVKMFWAASNKKPTPLS